MNDALTSPLVSFVVPCYKLAHLLRQCVLSILSQTYKNFEVLILDDCSPDNTPEVAASFGDLRVQHVRNEPNLGHLRNYNKGITLARGEYIWLISADDYLTDVNVLADYVRFMSAHPNAGYVCSSGFELTGEGQIRVADYTVLSNRDCIFSGKKLLPVLLANNPVLASSGMVRRACYEKLGVFPLDLPYAGDWYLWCLFAVHFDVAFIARPCVTYRLHDQSMTSGLLTSQILNCISDDLNVLWRIKGHAQKAFNNSSVKAARHALGRYYARQLVLQQYRGAPFRYTVEDCKNSIAAFAEDAKEAAAVWTFVQVSAGDLSFGSNNAAQAHFYYGEALRGRRWLPKVRLKDFLLQIGPVGSTIREGLSLIVRGVA